MKIIDAINYTDLTKPNVYPLDLKIRWLSNLDGQIMTNIISTHEGGRDVNFTGYDENTDINDVELLVPSPYDDIYIKWLEAQIDYAYGEYGKYNNSITAYNDAYSLFERYYNRTHMPKSKGKFKF